MKLLSIMPSFQFHLSFFLGILCLSLPAMDKETKKCLEQSGKLCSLITAGNQKKIMKLLGGGKRLSKKQSRTRKALNCCDKNGQLPLNLVISLGQFSLFTSLINMGADCNAIDQKGNTALHTLLLHFKQFSDWQVMFDYFVLHCTPDISLQNKAEKTPLDLARDTTDEKIRKRIKRLGSCTSGADTSGDSYEYSPPSSIGEEMVGVEFSSCPIATINNLIRTNNLPAFIKESLKHKNVNELLNGFDAEGILPLNYTIILQRHELFTRLMKYDLNINAVDKAGNTPLHTIVNQRKKIPDIDESSPLWTSLPQDKKNELVLALNTWKKMFLAIKALRPDPTLKNHSGLTALDYAIETGRPKLAEQLLDLGADSTCGIIAAVQKLQHHMIALFIDHGAEYSSIDEEGNTPLHNLLIGYRKLNLHEGKTLSNWHATLAAVLALKPEMNRFNVKGKAPLHLGVETRNLDIVKQLVEAGADVNARIDDEQDSPFELAVKLFSTKEAKKEFLIEQQNKLEKEHKKGSHKKAKKYKADSKRPVNPEDIDYLIGAYLISNGAVVRHQTRQFGSSSCSSSFESAHGSFGSFGSPPLNSPPRPPSFYLATPRARSSSISSRLAGIDSPPGRKDSVEKLLDENDPFKKTSVEKKKEYRSHLAEQLNPTHKFGPKPPVVTTLRNNNWKLKLKIPEKKTES